MKWLVVVCMTCVLISTPANSQEVGTLFLRTLSRPTVTLGQRNLSDSKTLIEIEMNDAIAAEGHRFYVSGDESDKINVQLSRIVDSSGIVKQTVLLHSIQQIKTSPRPITFHLVAN